MIGYLIRGAMRGPSAAQRKARDARRTARCTATVNGTATVFRAVSKAVKPIAGTDLAAYAAASKPARCGHPGHLNCGQS